jgi:hypothetical protein
MLAGFAVAYITQSLVTREPTDPSYFIEDGVPRKG